MNGLSRLNSANHLRSAAAYPKRSLRPFTSRRFSRRPHQYGRKVLPPELHSRNVVLLTYRSSARGGFCHVYLVGTYHNSQKSRRQVGDVIKFLQPQIVFLEMCYSRRGLLVEDGSEFAVAYKEARKYGGEVILGDRPYNITTKRTWAKMPLRHKTLLVPAFLLYESLSRSATFNRLVDQWVLDKCDDDDGSEALLWMSRFPTFMETILHERDQYMSAMLLEVAQKHNSVVAVVGKNHLAGIRKNWKQPVDTEELLRTPTATGMSTIITSKLVLRVALIGGIIYLSKSFVFCPNWTSLLLVHRKLQRHDGRHYRSAGQPQLHHETRRCLIGCGARRHRRKGRLQH